MAGAFSNVSSNQIRVVKVTQETAGNPGTFPNTTSRCVYKCIPAVVTYSPVEGSGVTIMDSTDPDKAIYVANFRNNSPVLGNYYLVFQLSPGIYVFDNQMAFLENQ